MLKFLYFSLFILTYSLAFAEDTQIKVDGDVYLLQKIEKTEKGLKLAANFYVMAPVPWLGAGGQIGIDYKNIEAGLDAVLYNYPLTPLDYYGTTFGGYLKIDVKELKNDNVIYLYGQYFAVLHKFDLNHLNKDLARGFQFGAGIKKDRPGGAFLELGAISIQDAKNQTDNQPLWLLPSLKLGIHL